MLYLFEDEFGETIFVCMSKHVEAARVIVWHELVVSEKNHA